MQRAIYDKPGRVIYSVYRGGIIIKVAWYVLPESVYIEEHAAFYLVSMSDGEGNAKKLCAYVGS